MAGTAFAADDILCLGGYFRDRIGFEKAVKLLRISEIWVDCHHDVIRCHRRAKQSLHENKSRSKGP